ncbi:MAG: hypothetical protein IPO16_05200 [Saprospiraceae bacterium]|nr:hypothetical protein [Saprospiraceae bacterium]
MNNSRFHSKKCNLNKCNKLTHFITLILIISYSNLKTQSKDPFQINQLSQSESVQSKNIIGTEVNSVNVISEGIRYYKLNKKNILSIKNQFNSIVSIKIPTNTGKSLPFVYTEYDFFTPNFEVVLIKNTEQTPMPVDKGIHLKGKILNDENSFSSLSVYENELYGTAYSNNGNKLNILPFENGNTCLVIDEDKISINKYATACHADDYRHYIEKEVDLQSRLSDNCKIVSISVNVDYELYLKFKGNIQSITNYVTGLFNNVHTLYKRENISIALAQIIIHSTKDGFTHITANEDLDYFRKKYPNINKTVKILLSGYSKNNLAPLGGISYINTLCNSSYAYAYANVLGTYVNAPAYSWDVFMVTHEIGHVLGSRHTHACVWGPSKNKAIDNCAKLEGSCSNPGVPVKGTIMSYCFQSGMPGIDLNLGFGTEPGNLIRQRIASSNCVTSYVPNNKTQISGNSIIEANLECSDGVYTHYYFDNNTIDAKDDILILSINKKGNNIGNLNTRSLTIKLHTSKDYDINKTSQITASYVDRSQSFFVSNKYWEISTTLPPVSNVSILYYFSNLEVESLKSQIGSISTSDLKLFNILSPGNPDPSTNHMNTQKENFVSYASASKLDSNKYIYSKSDSNTIVFELSSKLLANSSIGIFNTVQNFVNFSKLNVSNKSTQNNIQFTTLNETNCAYFIIEKSKDQLKFDSIGKVQAKGNSKLASNYTFNYSGMEYSETVYRIKAINQNKQVAQSPIFSNLNIYSYDNTLSVYPNPVKTGVLFVDYNNQSTNLEVTINISDIYGRLLTVYKKTVVPGINYFSINTSELKDGLHYLSIVNKSNTQKLGFTVSK